MDETETVGAELVPAEGTTITTQQIEQLGLLMPLASPAIIRAAFAERQRVLTSILDPERDFLYSVSYTDNGGQQRSKLFDSLEATKNAMTHLGVKKYSAHPRKSGCLKLAQALGIESKCISVVGLPTDPNASYSSCIFVATHKKTGRSEEGQGFCDFKEKPGKAHVVISMANTRAYCHAVLRCAGYDNVGADEVEGLGWDGGEIVTIAPYVNGAQAPALVGDTTPVTVTAEIAKATPAPTVAQQAQAIISGASRPAPTEQMAPKPQTAPAEPLPEGVITRSMAADLSALLMSKLGSKDKALAWLKTNAGVERSIHVKEDQYATLTVKLNEMETP